MTPFCRVRWSTWRMNDEQRHHGVLMSEAVYTATGGWICIVATPTGNREMNPLELTVTGVWVPGEPLEPEQ